MPRRYLHAESRRLNESLHLKIQNKRSHGHLGGILICLIESPYEKIGKFVLGFTNGRDLIASMKAPPKRKGNLIRNRCNMAICGASMKVPPQGREIS